MSKRLPALRLPRLPPPRADDSTASAANSANLFSFRAGDKLSGVTVTLAEGAASLQGQVVSGNEKTATRLRVHLVPADQAAAEDLLRYYRCRCATTAHSISSD
jgi:hypothetical protein